MISEDRVRQLEARMARLERATHIKPGPGINIIEWPGGTSISLDAGTAQKVNDNSGAVDPESASAVMFFALITGCESAGPNRWAYTFEQVRKPDSLGYDGNWFPVDKGASGMAYNGTELPNSATGVQGNGVDVDNLPDGWELQPCPPGVVVRMWKSSISKALEPEYWFEYANAVDGSCS
jgi:hypothetical protein